MPLWRPAFPGSFREEIEVETAITATGERSSFQAWGFETEWCPLTFIEPNQVLHLTRPACSFLGVRIHLSGPGR